MRRWTGILIILCLLLAAAHWGMGAGAESLHTEVENQQLEIEAVIGYDGMITYGKPIPLRVTVRNRGGDLEATLAVNGYVSSRDYDRFETELSVPAGSERTVVLPVQADTVQGVFTAEIVRDGKVIRAVNAVPSGTINPSAMLIGVLSSRPRNLSNLDISAADDPLLRYEYWQTVPLTPETLPEDPDLLGAFGMMVLDDTDPALLTEKQRNALLNWVSAGHVLMVGGGTAGARNLAFLGDAVSLQADAFPVSDRVLEALENYHGQQLSGRRPEIALCSLKGGEPLIRDAEGNDLVYWIPMGHGSVVVLAWEAGDATLNSERLMHAFYQKMILTQDANLYNRIMYRSEDSAGVYGPDGDTRLKVHTGLAAGAAIAAGALVIGLLLWFILKRKGATSWMWLALPLLSAAAAAALVLLSGSSSLTRPLAVVAENRIQGADGETVRATAVSVEAPRAGIYRISLDGEQATPLIDGPYYYWGEEEDDTPKEPAKLRVIRFRGRENGAAFNAETPWQRMSLSAHSEEAEGTVEAEIWMEADGLHGQIRNGKPWGLKAGAVLCNYGFVRIPALAPGESASFALLSGATADPQNPEYTDGVMVRNAPASSLYAVQNQYFYGSGEERYGSRESTLSGLVSAASGRLSDQQTGRKGGDLSSGMFLYCAEPEAAFTGNVRVNGEAPGALTTFSMFTAEIRYLTVGRTGVVFHPPGTDRAVRCELDASGNPAGVMSDTSGRSYAWYPVSEMPTFRFTLQDATSMNITSLSLNMESWYTSDVQCYVLHSRLKTWVQAELNAPLLHPEKYLDASGSLYVQFRPVTPDSYAEIPAPGLTLEGTVKQADR